MFTRTILFAGVAASLINLAIPSFAEAQAPTFGVQATAETSLAASGTYNKVDDNQPGGTFAAATSDPAGLQFYNGYGQVYGDALSEADAEPGRLHAVAKAESSTVTAKAFGNAVPYAVSYARYYDVLTVESASLPVGTPVKLTFRSDVDVLLSYTGNYDGSINLTLNIGAATATSKWEHKYTGTHNEVYTPLIVVNTTVGARLKVDGTLRAIARAVWFSPGPNYGANVSFTADAALLLESASQDVTLRADSGAIYTAVNPL